MSVIDAEIELMQKFIANSKDHAKEFFQEKFNNLKFAKETLESNCMNGFISPDKYLSDVKAYLKQ